MAEPYDVIQELRELGFDSRTSVEEWWMAPHPDLEGKRPVEVVTGGPIACDRLIDLIRQEAHRRVRPTYVTLTPEPV